MTPEETAETILQRFDLFDGYPDIAAAIAAAIRAAINDKLEEVAKEIERLESGHYTTAQTPAGLVRAMKEG